jgi:hypothetical protein
LYTLAHRLCRASASKCGRFGRPATSLFFHAIVLLQLGVFDSNSREVFGTAKVVLGEIEIKEGILAKFGHEFSVAI